MNRFGRILILAAFSAMVAAARTGAAQPGAASVTLAQLATGSNQDLKSTLVEIAYIGPVNKLFATIDVSGGVDPLIAYGALREAMQNVIPPQADPIPFKITPVQLRKVLLSVSGFSSGAAKEGMVGIYVVQLTTHRTAVLEVDAETGRKALAALTAAMPSAPTRSAVRNLRQMIFPA